MIQIYGLGVIKTWFKGTFFLRPQNVPTNWTDPTVLVCFHILVPVSRLVWMHTHTNKISNSFLTQIWSLIHKCSKDILKILFICKPDMLQDIEWFSMVNICVWNEDRIQLTLLSLSDGCHLNKTIFWEFLQCANGYYNNGTVLLKDLLKLSF